ncbi:MAG TPA: ZIP family metal transporter [Halococcus sp.]|nr:ZIP family metal transporter [Halococcus sp.]
MLGDFFVDIVGTDPVVQGLAGGIFITFLNLVGASIVLVWRDPTEKWLDAALGFAAGVMLSASFTSLLMPGIEFASAPGYRAIQLGGFALVGVVPVLIGFFLGVAVLDRGERWVRYVGPLISNRLVSDANRTDGGEMTDGQGAGFTGPAVESGPLDARVMSVLLFTVAITLHNMPEGLAVGVGFGSENISNAISLMIAIGLQNIPEGLAVSVAAINAGLGHRWYAAVAGIRAGLVEIPLAVLGAWAVTVAAPILPYAMGFAAGGMLYVIADEIVPQTHSRGHERLASLGLMVGAAVMLALDVALA